MQKSLEKSVKKPPLNTEFVPPEGKEKNPHTLGWITIIVIFGLLGTWAALSKIEMTVKSGGKVISKGYKKAIQHPRGGIVTKLYVKEGDLVKQGDPILELDPTELHSRLESAIDQYDSLLLQKARLEAESNMSSHVDFDRIRPKILRSQEAEHLIEREKALFKSQLSTLQKQIDLLNDKIHILQIQNKGYQQQIESDKRQLESYRRELAKWQELYNKKMTDELKLLERKRRIEQIQARISQERSKISENNATIESYKNNIELARYDFVNKARQKLKEISLKLDTLHNRIIMLKNALERQTLKAPDSGTIVDMKVHTPGEVVLPNRPVAYVVPNRNQLLMELFIKPTDIDKVHVGQLADIHFPSYVDPAALPIEGKVTYVSADAIQPPGSKRAFFKALVELTPKGIVALKKNGFSIVPGMPVSAYIKAGKRSFMSYILLPLERLAKGAFHAN